MPSCPSLPVSSSNASIFLCVPICTALPPYICLLPGVCAYYADRIDIYACINNVWCPCEWLCVSACTALCAYTTNTCMNVRMRICVYVRVSSGVAQVSVFTTTFEELLVCLASPSEICFNISTKAESPTGGTREPVRAACTRRKQIYSSRFCFDVLTHSYTSKYYSRPLHMR